MAFKFVFLRTPKPRQFYHKPIYWDPEKEEREEAIAAAKKNAGIKDENEPFKTSIKRGSFRKNRFDQPENIDHNDEIRKARRLSNIRFAIIAIILFIIAIVFYCNSSDFLNL